MGNIMTKAMEKTTALMVTANKRLGEMGEMPYGMRKATPTERKSQKAQAVEAEMQELRNG